MRGDKGRRLSFRRKSSVESRESSSQKSSESQQKESTLSLFKKLLQPHKESKRKVVEVERRQLENSDCMVRWHDFWSHSGKHTSVWQSLGKSIEDSSHNLVHSIGIDKFLHYKPPISTNGDKGSPRENKQAILRNWFRTESDRTAMMLRGLARWGAQEISGNPALDERYPMILINGLPFVGKSTVARELAYLLDDGNRPGLVTTLREAAFNFFGDPSPRPSKDRASASAHKRDKHHRPIEVFADGRAIVIDVEHLSLALHAENGEHVQQPGGGHTSQSSKPDAQTASSVARYCSSLSTLARKKPSSDAADRLDRGRRSALEEGLLHEKRSASAVIFTEYLPKYNGESGEFAAKSYRTAADVFDRRLIPIYLTCSEAEHQRRFECRQREEHQYVQAARARGVAFSENQIAAMAPAGLQQAAHALKKLHCGEEDVYYFSKPAHFVNQQFQLGPRPVFGEPTAPEAYQGVRIDSTGLTALETAMVIRDFIHDVQRGEPGTTTLLWPPTQKERERKYLEELESWVVVSRNEETNRGVEASK